MSEHTRGPWIVKGEPNLLCVTDRDSAYIVDRFVLGDRPYEEHLANAKLIAAAPTQHAALAEVEDLLGFHEGSEERASDSPTAAMVVKINADDFARVLKAVRDALALASSGLDAPAGEGRS